MFDFTGKYNLQAYSKSEFTELLNEIFSAKGGEDYQEKLIRHFTDIVPCPEGMDLIFWVPDDEANAETIIKKIESWCKTNKKPAFADSHL